MLVDLLNQNYLNLLNPSYPSISLNQNQSDLINMYLEEDKSKGRYPVIALPMPGLTLFSDTSQANVRALFEQNNVLYVVAGNKFYSVDSNGVITQIGTLNTSSGFAKIKSIAGAADNNNQLIIIDGTNGYHYNISTAVSQFPITDVDFPQDCIDIESQDEYFIVVKKNSVQVQISNIADGTTWDALDFASKLGKADRLSGLLSHALRLYLLGSKTGEIWYNSGNTGFPFTRLPDTFLHYGLASVLSLIYTKTFIFFLSKGQDGGYLILKLEPSKYVMPAPAASSYQPIAAEISSFSIVSDSIGYCYEMLGHLFYELSFPTANKTYTLDSDTGAITRRSSYNGSSYGRFLGNCQAFCYGKNFVGDYNSGKIYYQDSTNYTENGTPIKRTFVSPSIYQQGKRVIINRLQIDVETGIGSNKTFLLEKSLDDGNTWTTVNTFTVPEKGGRIFVSGLGSSRYGILFRITTTMNAKFIILGFQADIKVCHS